MIYELAASLIGFFAEENVSVADKFRAGRIKLKVVYVNSVTLSTPQKRVFSDEQHNFPRVEIKRIYISLA